MDYGLKTADCISVSCILSFPSCSSLFKFLMLVLSVDCVLLTADFIYFFLYNIKKTFIIEGGLASWLVDGLHILEFGLRI